MTPEAIVDEAVREGLSIIAITDHNEIRNVQRALDAAHDKGILVVPGVELSTPDGHLLCYTESLEHLQRFHGRLDLADAGKPNSRCRTAMLECLNLLHEQQGFAALAHVDVEAGFEQMRPGQSPHKTDVLCHPALLAIEVQRATSEISWAADDPDAGRRQAGRERIQRLNLGERQYLAKILGSDAHSLAALGHNADKAKRVTRVKVDGLSFSALRLSFEDCDARVRLEDQVPPAVPVIVGAHFDGGFLDGQTLHFSQNLNCIIGGRGTGKSTTFEAVRCLSRSTSDSGVIDSEVWPNALYLFWRDAAGVQHALYRTSGEAIQNLDDDIFGPTEFDIDCFGQGDTARISAAAKKDPLALLGYLDRFTSVREALQQENSAIQELKGSQQSVQTLETQVAAIPEFKRALELARKQLVALEKANAQGLIELQRKVEEERALRQQIVQHANQLQNTYVPSVHPAAAHLRAAAPAAALTLGATEFDEIVSAVEVFERKVSVSTSDNQQAWQAVVKRINEGLALWKAKETDKLAEIETKRKELEAQGVRLDMTAIRRVAQDEARHQKTLLELEAKVATLKELRRQHDQVRNRRWSSREKVATVRTAYAAAANRVLGAELSDLQVTLRFVSGAYSPESDELIINAMGWRTNQQPRASVLTQQLTVRRLLECIEHMDAGPIEALENEEKVKQFSRAEAADILAKLAAPAVRDRLEISEIHDLPRLIVTKKVEDPKGGKPRYVNKDFARLSLGQQQSVLLALMLSANTDVPLIIDQPEDNLDGEFIYHTLVPVLRRAKERRQIIIVTHNANIAVLGDAELIVVLKSGNDRGQVVARGAIDERETRKEACKILEGASEAFQRRARTYGFKVARE